MKVLGFCVLVLGFLCGIVGVLFDSVEVFVLGFVWYCWGFL